MRLPSSAFSARQRCRNSSIRNSCSIRLCLRDFFVAKTLDPGGAKSLGLVIRAGNKACAPGVISLVSTACSKSQLEEARSECEKHFGDAAGILAVYSSHRMASLHVLLWFLELLALPLGEFGPNMCVRMSVVHLQTTCGFLKCHRCIYIYIWFIYMSFRLIYVM